MSKNRKSLIGVLGQLDFDTDKQKTSRPAKGGEGVLAQRSNTLDNLVSGSTSAVFQQKIDPDRCRLWSGNGRDYGLLNEGACRDLIDSLIAQGRQEIPAIVRKLTDDPDHDFELIVGFRRHWSVSWLRRNGYPDFQFLVEVRDLTDEAAFRLADIENRSRADITDYERAKSYLDALGQHYDGNQSRMAKRLEVSASWLSRYLNLAKLPDEVVDAFASTADLNFKVARDLAPLLQTNATRKPLLEEAKKLQREQGENAVKGAAVLSRLVDAGKGGKPGQRPKPTPRKALSISSTRDVVTISLSKSAQLDLDAALRNIREALENEDVATWQ